MTALGVDNTFDDPTRRAPLVLGHTEFGTVTAKICSVHEAPRAPKAWYICIAISSVFMGILGILIAYLFWTGGSLLTPRQRGHGDANGRLNRAGGQ